MPDHWDDEPFDDPAVLQLWLAQQSGEFPELDKHRWDNWINYGPHEDGRLCVKYQKCCFCLSVAQSRIFLVQRSLLELRAMREREKHREQTQRQLAEIYEELGDWAPTDDDLKKMAEEYFSGPKKTDQENGEGIL